MTNGQCVRAYVYESRVFVSMVLMLIFAEVLGLYGCVLPLRYKSMSNKGHNTVSSLHLS